MNISAYLGVAGLVDVGYRFYTTTETAVAVRVTTGIVDAGDGWYSAEVTLTATTASVRWDSTGTAEAKAREYWPDPWGLPIPDGYPAGTAGKILGDNINATISSRATPAQVATELTTYGALKPTVAGRALDVSTGGEAGLDWANIGAPTTTQALSATTIATVTNLTNDPPGVTTLLARITSTLFSGITSLKEWLGLLAGKQTGNTTARTEIRSTGAGSGTFDETVDSQEALRDRGDAAWITGAGGDPWATAVPGAYAAGTAGNILGNRLDAAVSTRAAPGAAMTLTSAYDAAKTAATQASVNTIGNVTSKLDTALELDGAVYRYTTNALEQAPTGGGGGADPWLTLLPGAYGAGTAGKILGTNLDATVSSRMPTSSYVAPDNVGISAIKSKTDNLPTDPADASDIAASFTTVNGKLDTISGAVDTEVAAIKAKTDALPANPASVSDIPTAIQNADTLLKRDMAAVTGEASRSPLNAIRLLRNKWSAVETPNTLTVKKEDDVTTAWQASLTTDSAAAPITSADPAG